MPTIHRTDILHPGLRSVLLSGANALPDASDDIRLIAEAIQHLTHRLGCAESALTETHDRCALCGGWMLKTARAVRLRIWSEDSTYEDARIIAYHGLCLEEQDPESIKDMIVRDSEKVGGDGWSPASGGTRIAAIYAALLRGLPERDGVESMYQIILEQARTIGAIPREWTR